MILKAYLLGFLLFCSVAAWLLFQIKSGSEALYANAASAITDLQQKRQAVSYMAAAGRDRSIILLAILSERDAFEQDELYQQLGVQALQFIAGQNILKQMHLTPEEKIVFDEIMRVAAINAPLQMGIADLIIEGESEQASKLLFLDALPNQNQLVSAFESMLLLIEANSQGQLDYLQNQVRENHASIVILSALGALASLILILIMWRRIQRGETLLSDSETVMSNILNTAGEAVINIDKYGTIGRFNKAAELLFGYSKNEIVGENISLLTPSPYTERYDSYLSHYRETGDQYFIETCQEVAAKHKDGTEFPVSLAVSDTGIDGPFRFTGVLHDLTEAKRTEDELKRRTIELEYANSRYKRLSETDPLTKIANRRVYEEQLSSDISLMKRVSQPLGMLLIDIDCFKPYNDNYGHDAGDITLKRIAEVIVESMPRSTDLAARFGGEEFVVLLPATDNEGVMLVAERIRRHVKALAIKHDHSACTNVVTVSIGIAILAGDALNEYDLFKQADTALYKAKEAGRNQCMLFDE